MSYSLFEKLAITMAELEAAGDFATLQALKDEYQSMAAELEHDWAFHGRPEQFAPEGHWTTWLIVAGRGFGKTRAGAEWVRKMAMENPGCRIALVGRASGDATQVMIHGDSGIIAISPEDERPHHKISTRELIWPNGSVATTFSAMEPDQLRGPQFHFAWADEAAAWKFVKDASGLNAWDNLNLATRLGSNPRIIATTTPKRTEFMIELLDKFNEQEEKKRAGDFNPKKGEIVITRGSTYDNAANLAESYLADMTGKYEGTNIAKQELLGLMLDDKEGALWDPSVLDDYRWKGGDFEWRQLPLRIVALDPSVSDNPKDECGIIVVGSSNHRLLHKRHAYVLEDGTLRGSPDEWAQKAVDLAKAYNCPIVAEATQGQALVERMIKSIDPTIKVYLVQTGNRGKKVRAEPVILPYEQGRVHHVDHFENLELQLTTWDPEISKKSPDRLDALVHGITALLIKPPKGFTMASLRGYSANRSGRTLPKTGGRGTGRTFRQGTGK
jgi:phage terminase large subunit-like protein